MHCRALAAVSGTSSSGSGGGGASGPTTCLPNGLAVRYVSKPDVLFLYEETYRRRCYQRHGVALPRGGTVLDVGANIGMFAIAAAEELGPQGLVVSCEPLPPTYDCLQHNAAAHRRWWREQRQEGVENHKPEREAAAAAAVLVPAGAAASTAVIVPTRAAVAVAVPEPAGNRARAQQRQEQQQQPWQQQDPASQAPAPIVALNVGVGDGSAAAATFTFYPRAAGWSSMLPSSGDVVADMGTFLANALSSPEASSAAGMDPATAAAGRWLRAWAPRWLYGAAWRGAVRLMLGGAHQYSCPIATVSQLIREHQLQAVDLLKVDVERAELDVLRGVEACHWPLIRQAALEVHACNLEEVLLVLRGQAGFSTIVVEQEAALAGSSLHAVFCRRD